MVEVFAGPEALFRAGAARVVSAIRRAVAASGRCALALSGGSTPAGLFRTLAAEPFASGVDWAGVDFYWGDERCVAPEHPASNFRLAKHLLLDHVAVPGRNVHRIPGEADPEEAARHYEAVLREAFRTPVGPPTFEPGSRFDLILLGLGEDGHTASLFAGEAAVREASRWVVAVEHRGAEFRRVTLTPPVINASAEVIFMVSGAGKAEVLRRVLREPPRPELLPAQIIAPVHGRLDWLVDAAAAGALGPDGGLSRA